MKTTKKEKEKCERQLKDECSTIGMSRNRALGRPGRHGRDSSAVQGLSREEINKAGSQPRRTERQEAIPGEEDVESGRPAASRYFAEWEGEGEKGGKKSPRAVGWDHGQGSRGRQASQRMIGGGGKSGMDGREGD